MKPNPRSFAAMLVVAAAALTLATNVSAANWKEKVLYSFQGGNDGAVPAGGVVFDKQGNLYGATTDGGSTSCRGPFQCGTVYQLQPPAKRGDPWTEKVLWVFKGSDGNDGASPFSGLVWDHAGNLYGATGYDGSGNCMLFGSRVGCGVVYQLKPPQTKGGAWTETVIYNFRGGSDGQLPIGDLVFDAQGNLYGATEYGGGFGTCNAPFYQHCGTIFQLSPPKTKGGKWKEKVLYSFKGGKDGANPNGGLIFDGAGAIYGTTLWGGSTTCQGVGCGTAFELKAPTKAGGTWTEKVLHRFTDGSDGANPNGGLIFDANGLLYGTGVGGGSGRVGVVFRLRPKHSDGWVETVLYNFQGTTDGRNPSGPVTLDPAGNLYGTTNAGGSNFGGTLFRMTPAKRQEGRWLFALLYSYRGPPDSQFPAARLIFDKNGTLYSTTSNGGTGQMCQAGCGTVFKASSK